MDRSAVMTTLRAQEAELRGLGIETLSLFGSVARGDAGPRSDVDLAAHFAPDFDLFRYGAVVERLRAVLSRPVDLVSEPASRPALRAEIDRDRTLVF